MLDWLDGEQDDFANALLAELGPSHPLLQRYTHMLKLQRAVTPYVLTN